MNKLNIEQSTCGTILTIIGKVYSLNPCQGQSLVSDNSVVFFSSCRHAWILPWNMPQSLPATSFRPHNISSWYGASVVKLQNDNHVVLQFQFTEQYLELQHFTFLNGATPNLSRADKLYIYIYIKNGWCIRWWHETEWDRRRPVKLR
jgi:hypothetical protein